jgi:APA family basic amino acid/polyamine antiporter
LTTGLTLITWIRFVVWLVIGLAIYFFYSMRRSEFSPAAPAPEATASPGEST